MLSFNDTWLFNFDIIYHAENIKEHANVMVYIVLNCQQIVILHYDILFWSYN